MSDQIPVDTEALQAERKARIDRVFRSDWFQHTYASFVSDRPLGKQAMIQKAMTEYGADVTDGLMQIADAVGCDSPAWPDVVRAVKDLVEGGPAPMTRVVVFELNYHSHSGKFKYDGRITIHDCPVHQHGPVQNEDGSYNLPSVATFQAIDLLTERCFLPGELPGITSKTWDGPITIHVVAGAYMIPTMLVPGTKAWPWNPCPSGTPGCSADGTGGLCPACARRAKAELAELARGEGRQS